MKVACGLIFLSASLIGSSGSAADIPPITLSQTEIKAQKEGEFSVTVRFSDQSGRLPTFHTAAYPAPADIRAKLLNRSICDLEAALAIVASVPVFELPLEQIRNVIAAAKLPPSVRAQALKTTVSAFDELPR